jgi:alkylation response protein AidB-like acyl-CoA dehydrogenase
MNQDFVQELSMIGELARDFSIKELDKEREEHDRYPFSPLFTDVIEKAFEAGFFSIFLPGDMGGMKQGLRALSLLVMRLGSSDPSLSGILITNALAQAILIEAGERDILAGKISAAKSPRECLIAVPAYINPVETKLSMTYKKDSSGYRLSGSMPYVVLGGISSAALVPAENPGVKGVSYFLFNLDESAIKKSEPVTSLGLRACPAVDLTCNDVPARLVGNEGEGDVYFKRAGDLISISASAVALGIMKGSFETALSYTKERFQGGREIIGWSEVRMILAEMATSLYTSRLALAGAIKGAEEKPPDWELSSRAAALFITDAAARLTTDGIQLLGGNGYMSDYGQEKRFRDAKQIQSFLGVFPMRKLGLVEELLRKDNGDGTVTENYLLGL